MTLCYWELAFNLATWDNRVFDEGWGFCFFKSIVIRFSIPFVAAMACSCFLAYEKSLSRDLEIELLD